MPHVRHAVEEALAQLKELKHARNVEEEGRFLNSGVFST
jgi:hypothetical protein